MTPFDLLFLALALGALVTLAAAAMAALRGRRARALALLGRLGIAAAAYFTVVLGVSLAAPPRRLQLGEDRCADDWCVAVTGVRRERAGAEQQYQVRLRLSSRARGISQRERFVAVYLRDRNGRRYDPLPEPGAVPFDTLLRPGESVEAMRRFRVPAGVVVQGLVIAREGLGGRIPACCIIGDENSLLHRRPMLAID